MALLQFAKRTIKVPLTLFKALPHRKDYMGEFWRIVAPRLLFTWFPTERNSDTYNQAMLGFLERHLPMPKEEELPQSEPVERMRIWAMWWQGADQMPPVVRACHESLLRHSRGLEVVLITRDNVDKYVKLPEHIRRKVAEGRILLPALSDYIRVSLLSEYGGIWVDSTMFFIRDIPEAAISSPFYTIRRTGNDINTFCVSHSKWNGQFLASSMTHCRIFEKERRMWETYWERHDSNIEYLMTDFLKARIFATDSEARRLLDTVAPSNKNLYKLAENINKSYDKALWEEMSEDQDCFKLTYKMKFETGDTFYHRLLAGKLGV